MDSSEFVTTEEVVAEATELLNDSDFTHGIGKSFYELIAHRTVEDLALNMFFSKVTKDVFNWNTCGDGLMDIPKGLFNVREIYLFNSSCDNERSACEGSCGETCGDCCKSKSCWTTFVEAHWKRMFNKFGSTGIKTAKIAPGKVDPVYLRDFTYSDMPSTSTRPVGTLVFFGIQNGQIAFSDSALCFKNVRIVANGFGADNCELPIIPRPLRRVCVDKVKLDACKKMMIYYPEYKDMYAVYKLDLYGDGSVQNPGTWLQAERYVKSLNTKQRNDLFEYFGNIDIK